VSGPGAFRGLAHGGTLEISSLTPDIEDGEGWRVVVTSRTIEASDATPYASISSYRGTLAKTTTKKESSRDSVSRARAQDCTGSFTPPQSREQAIGLQPTGNSSSRPAAGQANLR